MATNQTILDLPLFITASGPITFGHAIFVLLGLVLFGAFSAYLMLRRSRATAQKLSEETARQAADAELRLAEILRAQSEMQGRMASMAEIFGSRQAELNKTINERLDGMTQRLGHSMTEQTKSTHENLQKLQERLAVIDNAQNNIQTLAKDVVGLQAILSNKQTRGAFGQSRMETIVSDGLPMGAYTFQTTLSNGNRPDCVVKMPNGQPSLVIDAKFPLEAYNAIRDADNPDAAKQASQSFRRDMEVHIRDISEKYLIKGETQDTAFMFVPSESIFAELHENFEGVIQRAHKARVVIVSPSLLMLSIQVIQSVLKDARMREQAHLIQSEVINLMADLTRLDDRVQKLQNHFNLTQKDVEQILTSTGKLIKRGEKIEAMEFEAANIQSDEKRPSKEDGRVESKTGLLKLRVVDDE